MEELYYLAGIIDGEGTITLSRHHSSAPFRHPIISVSSTTKEIIDYLHQNYHGSVSKHKTYQDHHKQSWSWKLQYSATIELCSKLFPLLKEPAKAYRAKLISQTYPKITNRNGKYTDEQRAAKLQFEYDFFHPSTP